MVAYELSHSCVMESRVSFKITSINNYPRVDSGLKTLVSYKLSLECPFHSMGKQRREIMGRKRESAAIIS